MFLFVFSFLHLRAYQKVMMMVISDHMVACPLGLLFLFHQSKLIARFFDTHFLEVGCKFKLVMPLLCLLEQYLRGTRTSNQGNQNLG